MKFEIINGKLCRMVEPTPLTPDSTFPCVAKFIFDDTPMGRCNKAFRPGAKDMVYLVDGDHGVNTPEEIFMCDIEDLDRGGEYNMAFEYEIIGYPVDRGSAAWAMWQWMNGKGVSNKGGLLVVSNKAANEYDDKTWEIISSMPDGWATMESQQPFRTCYADNDAIVMRYMAWRLNRKEEMRDTEEHVPSFSAEDLLDAMVYALERLCFCDQCGKINYGDGMVKHVFRDDDGSHKNTYVCKECDEVYNQEMGHHLEY